MARRRRDHSRRFHADPVSDLTLRLTVGNRCVDSFILMDLTLRLTVGNSCKATSYFVGCGRCWTSRHVLPTCPPLNRSSTVPFAAFKLSGRSLCYHNNTEREGNLI